jgi:hypothetical protein
MDAATPFVKSRFSKKEQSPRCTADLERRRTPSSILIVSTGLPVETRFIAQCAHRAMKHFLKSAGRPENPQVFRPAQFSLSMKRRAADFHRS